MVRIRKNATLSPLLFCSHASPEDLQPHVCQLNQSPWESSNPCFLDSSWNQFEVDDCFYGNTSLGDSIKDNESVSSPSMMDIDNKPNVAANDGSDDMLRCQKHDGKSWRCKNPVKKGFQVCEHHFKLIRRRCLKYYEYSGDEDNKDKNNGTTTRNGIANSLPSKKAFVPEKPPRRGRPPKAKKGASAAAASSSNNPYEFYYYSGFKPRLSTRRGVNEDKRVTNEDKEEQEEAEEGEEEEQKIDGTENVATSSTITSTSIPSQKIENGEVQFDYIEDDFYDDDEDEDDEGGPKRMRKPVKARSLKSLM